MHTHYAMLLAILFFLASIDTVSAHAQPKPTVVLRQHFPAHLLTSNGSVGAAKRLLRSYKVSAIDGSNTEDEADSEERLSVSKLVQLDRATWRLRKVDMKLSELIWIAAGRTPAFMFKRFHLDSGKKIILENKKLVQWFRFTQTYRNEEGGVDNFPDRKIVSLLEKHISKTQMKAVL
uniref:RxLR effector protein n=1 Tax=Phytophthora sojae TaxID=67593 RepID=G1FSQ3_PHYSO|nr:Avh308 [Phytophthora sojae]